eukprot:Gregarina_sp_Poly_1__5311@NODE_2809_length_1688_cov_146_412708_g1770_i0_p1_GENE_NODE_2809_length_1688_cov_146_412708_g1770_i0NODE_2809_length_1688_cov_146_412708_g1770_i0_p1_ORF_typecomplete_len391_score99_63HOOK/PF05622_12/1_6e11HOOK/PF05622_12/1_4MAD/PF05557_13/0_0004MAD/PF05557_13/1_7Fez1/PF06818_15/39Fez1/PF06818_15/9_9HMMR_N/PF15905_5/0_0027HMMR_N/PF15905_5/0_76HMMR_N/PF15905_5/3_8CEP63/PF17045_5/0_0075CEP63/PF17045_5/0_078CEP63/PF17045_5/1_8DUF812/PF05667_11/0_39DUF812/PF05667_11/0_00015DU
MQSQLQAAQDDIKQKEQTIQTLEQTIKDYSRRVDELPDMQSQLQAAQDNIKQKEQTIQSLEQTIKENSQRIEDLTEKNRETINENQRQLEVIAGLRFTVEASQSKINESEAVKETMRRSFEAQLQRLREESSNKIRVLMETQHVLRNHNEEQENKIHDAEQTIVALENRLDAVQTEKMNAVESNASIVHSLEGRLRQMAEETAQKDRELIEKVEEIEQVQSKLKAATTQMAGLNAAQLKLERDLREKDGQLTNAMTALARLEEVAIPPEELEDLKAKLDACRRALQEAENDISARISVEDSLRLEVADLRTKVTISDQLLEERRKRNLLQRIFNIE